MEIEFEEVQGKVFGGEGGGFITECSNGTDVSRSDARNVFVRFLCGLEDVVFKESAAKLLRGRNTLSRQAASLWGALGSHQCHISVSC